MVHPDDGILLGAKKKWATFFIIFPFTMPFTEEKSLIFVYSNNEFFLNSVIYSFVVLSLSISSGHKLVA